MATSNRTLDQQKAIESTYRAFFQTDAGMDLQNYIVGLEHSATKQALMESEPVKAWSHLQKASAYATIRAFLDRKK